MNKTFNIDNGRFWATNDPHKVKAEMVRRGIWVELIKCPMNNHTYAALESREIFYHQRASGNTPELFTWGKYKTDADFWEVFDNFTTKRLTGEYNH